MGRFKKGLFFGGLLGAGLMWLNTTKKGKQVREQIVDASADVYEEVKKKIAESGALENMTKNKYMDMVRDVVDTYATKTGMADNLKNMVSKMVGSQWKQIKTTKKK
jgi:gas vesicle protein